MIGISGTVMICFKSLYNWFNHCSKKMKSLQQSKKSQDPIATLVNRLLGSLLSPPKLHTGWELWGAGNFTSMKEACNITFAESSKPECECAMFCNTYKKTKFLKLGRE